MAVWLIVLTISICATILATANDDYYVHAAVTAVIGLAASGLALRDLAKLAAAGASRSALAASGARHMGLVWWWGAISILLIYVVLRQDWPEWWHFFIAFVAGGGLSLGMAMMLGRDAEAGRLDETMLSLARYLCIGQIAGMLIAIIGLFVDRKFPRNPDLPDWAANNIFFFGALALMVISFYALKAEKKT